MAEPERIFIENKDLSLVARYGSFGDITVMTEPGGSYDVEYTRSDIAEAALEEAVETETERLQDALDKLLVWAKAYPIGIFPEPDFKAVRVALAKAKISLGAVSASNMRHVISGVQEIIEAALKPKEITEKKGG